MKTAAARRRSTGSARPPLAGKTFRRKFVVLVLLASGCLAMALTYYHRAGIRGEVMQVQAHAQPKTTSRFPSLNTAGFDDTRLKLLAQLQAAYAKKPVSFDETVLTYTDGVKEPWCADFVSWQMKELGQPFVNPNSGSWRIPGVYTLREYYQAQNRWQPAGTYVPKFGDVAIYASSPARSHTNIVLSANEKTRTMQTIGGNEEGRVRIKTKSYLPPHEDLVGFGIL